MPRLSHLLVAALALPLAACATTDLPSAPTEVMRYHLGQPIPAGTVAVEPGKDGIAGPEFATYASAVQDALGRIGFTAPAAGTPSDYIATVAFTRRPQGEVRTPPKFTIGLGGGSFGGGLGVGGGVSTGIGSKTRNVYGNEMLVQLRRRSDGTVMWEGNARSISYSGAGLPETNQAARMANALVKNFPGESGISSVVP